MRRVGPPGMDRRARTRAPQYIVAEIRGDLIDHHRFATLENAWAYAEALRKAGAEPIGWPTPEEDEDE